MLQCVAVSCCSDVTPKCTATIERVVLQYVAVCCGVLRSVAVVCSVLQCVAVCIVFLCFTVSCNELQYAACVDVAIEIRVFMNLGRANKMLHRKAKAHLFMKHMHIFFFTRYT